jgi:LysM repeat protein
MGLLSIFRLTMVPVTADTIVTIKSGDTFSNLSDRYNVFVSVLEQVNHKQDDDQLLVGDQILIPNTKKVVAKSTSHVKHAISQSNRGHQPTAEETWNQSNADAKAWISFHESTNSYTAENGQYYGRYQLDRAYLNGDYSPANQERVASQYVASRYGSWVNAKAHWETYNWY